MLKKFKLKRTDNGEAVGAASNEAAIGTDLFRISKVDLHKPNGSEIDLNRVPEDNGQQPADAADPQPVAAKRIDPARSQKTQKIRDDYVSVPYGMYSFQQVRKQPKPAKPQLSKDDAGDGEPKKKRKSVFGGFSKKSPNKAVDNFTMWDKPSANTRSTLGGVDGLLADSILGLAPPQRPAPPPPSDSKASLEDYDDSYYDALDVQQGWAAKPDGSKTAKGKGKQPAHLAAEQPYEQNGERSNSVSPVDSGIGLLEEDIPLLNISRDKGKGRAMLSASHSSDSPLEEVNRVLALEAALRDEINKIQQEWEDRLEALKIEKEELLERARQEQEDMERARQLQREEEERIAAELARLRECVCCGESKDPLEFPAHTATDSCEHESMTCNECMEAWLASEFDSKGTEAIKCPECPSTLTFDDVQRCADEKTFQSYEKILTRNALSSLPEFSWCLGAGCGSGQLNSENANFMDCASCGYKQCLQHKVAWHTGETCEAYEYRTSGQKERDEEKATTDMLDSVSKVCPGEGCGWRIQKIDGCDHMTCRRCRFEFCWECLASHREIKTVGNTAHQDWCKFHSKQLDVAWPFNMHG